MAVRSAETMTTSSGDLVPAAVGARTTGALICFAKLLMRREAGLDIFSAALIGKREEREERERKRERSVRGLV